MTQKTKIEELENKINEPAWKASLEKYKREGRKVKTGPFSKTGTFGIVGKDAGGLDYKAEIFYTEIDRIHREAKERPAGGAGKEEENHRQYRQAADRSGQARRRTAAAGSQMAGGFERSAVRASARGRR